MATYFRQNDPTGANDANDPVNKLVASGQYRDLPSGKENILQQYYDSKISQEDAIAKITNTPIFNPNIGPQMNIGQGNVPYDPSKITATSLTPAYDLSKGITYPSNTPVYNSQGMPSEVPTPIPTETEMDRRLNELMASNIDATGRSAYQVQQEQ